MLNVMNFHIFFTSLVAVRVATVVHLVHCMLLRMENTESQRHAKILLCAGHKAVYFVGLSHRHAAPVRNTKEKKITNNISIFRFSCVH